MILSNFSRIIGILLLTTMSALARPIGGWAHRSRGNSIPMDSTLGITILVSIGVFLLLISLLVFRAVKKRRKWTWYKSYFSPFWVVTILSFIQRKNCLGKIFQDPAKGILAGWSLFIQQVTSDISRYVPERAPISDVFSWILKIQKVTESSQSGSLCSCSRWTKWSRPRCPPARCWQIGTRSPPVPGGQMCSL